MIGAHRRLSPENRLFFENHNDNDTLLDLVEFAASANVPMFGVLPWSRLEQNQQLRYQEIVADYCGRVLVPSYGIFNDSELKAACADIQIAAIGKKITTDDETNAIDHYNLALAHIAGDEKTLAVNDLRTAVMPSVWRRARQSHTNTWVWWNFVEALTSAQ
jgi:spermidine synthase